MRGGYALLLGLPRTTVVLNRRTVALQPGVYIYSGSALGPGGIEARIRRHLRRRERQRTGIESDNYHWHVDLILQVASEIAAVGAYCDTKTECELVKLLKGRGMRVIEGFGSTDCRSGCGGHLIYYGGGGTDTGTDTDTGTGTDADTSTSAYGGLIMSRCIEEVKGGFKALGLEPFIIIGNSRRTDPAGRRPS